MSAIEFPFAAAAENGLVRVIGVKGLFLVFRRSKNRVKKGDDAFDGDPPGWPSFMRSALIRIAAFAAEAVEFAPSEEKAMISCVAMSTSPSALYNRVSDGEEFW